MTGDHDFINPTHLEDTEPRGQGAGGPDAEPLECPEACRRGRGPRPPHLRPCISSPVPSASCGCPYNKWVSAGGAREQLQQAVSLEELGSWRYRWVGSAAGI